MGVARHWKKALPGARSGEGGRSGGSLLILLRTQAEPDADLVVVTQAGVAHQGAVVGAQQDGVAAGSHARGIERPGAAGAVRSGSRIQRRSRRDHVVDRLRYAADGDLDEAD